MSETTNQPDERGLREILDHWYHVNDHAEADLIAWAQRQCERQREECAVYVTGLSDADAAVRATPIVEIDR